MKKFLIAALALTFFNSCDPDDPIVPPGYPTAGLTVEEKSNALVIMGYDFKSPAIAPYDIFRKLAEEEYGNSLNHMSFVADASSPFHNALTDSLMVYFQNPSAPYLILNSEIASSPGSIVEDLELLLEEKPIVSVVHSVSQDDTSWVVDSKVKFFEDTATQQNSVLIETYMTADIQARNYGRTGEDLRVQAANNIFKNTDSASFWDLEQYAIDSSRVIIKKGDPMYHNYIFLENSNRENILGTSLASYWSFGGDFHEGDIIGTEDTPIRHHLPKLEKGEYDYDRKLRFVTVIWIFNPVTSMYEYANSYSTGKQY